MSLATHKLQLLAAKLSYLLEIQSHACKIVSWTYFSQRRNELDAVLLIESATQYTKL